ncbi:MAG TPA: metallophosphoesterase, partial [Polyangiaceae bacterium]|nr:metallophosphoesterase [Polyangiaceae bacterium]
MVLFDGMAIALRWLHLSDLHVGLRDTGTNQRDSMRTFLEDVARLQEAVGSLDAVVFTGDLVQSGKREEFERLDAEVLDPLWKTLGLSNDVPLLAVPGNHDLQRPADTPNRLFADALIGGKDRDDIWRKDSDAHGFVKRCFHEYEVWWNRWWDARPGPRRPEPGMFPGDYRFTLAKHGLAFGFAGLNSALLHLGDVGEQTLWVHPDQLRGGEDVSAWLEGRAFNVLLTHHPPSWLHRGAQDVLLNALCASKFDLHVFGHQHEPRLLASGRERNLRRTIQAASLFGSEHWRMPDSTERHERRIGYSVACLEIHETRTGFRVWPRIAVKGHDETYRFAPDPTYDLQENEPLASEPFVFDLGERIGRLVSGASVAEVGAVASERPPDWGAWVRGWPGWKAVASDGERASWTAFAASVAAGWGRAAATAHAALQDDPWFDAHYPRRVLDRLAALKPAAFSGAEAAVLCLAPLLHQVSWTRELATVARCEPHEFARTADPSPVRQGLERVHHAWPRIVRRAMRVDAATRRALGFWLAYRAAQWSPDRWDLRGWFTDLQVPAPTLGAKDFADAMELVVRAVSPDADWLFGETSSLWTGDRAGLHIGDLTAWLAIASATALDLRTLDEAVVDHVGLDGRDLIGDLRRALRGAVWSEGPLAWDLRWRCRSPVEHLSLALAVDQANEILGRLLAHMEERRQTGTLELEPKRWPWRLSRHGLLPEVDAGGRPEFSPRHVRFRLDHHRVRELLIGQQLYGDPALAIRELYQNALDACRYRRARQIEEGTYEEPRIVLRQGTTRDGRSFIECEDDGIGMTEQVLADVFAIAGRRFHDTPQWHEERQRWERRARAVAKLSGGTSTPEAAALCFQPNSQHGIGVLSYFMLADDLEIHTRPCPRRDAPNQRALRVRISSASGLFRIEELPKGALPRSGTRVRLFLNEEARKRAPSDKPLSLVDVVKRLIWIAEFPTEAHEGCATVNVEGVDVAVESRQGRSHSLKIGEPPSQMPEREELRGLFFTRTADRNVWWASHRQLPLLVDGICTDVLSPQGLLVNLTGTRYPTMSADRRQPSGVRLDWLTPVLLGSLDALSGASWLTLDWVQGVLAEDDRYRFDGRARRADPSYSVRMIGEPLFECLVATRKTLPLAESKRFTGERPAWWRLIDHDAPAELVVAPDWDRLTTQRLSSYPAWAAHLAGMRGCRANPRKPDIWISVALAGVLRSLERDEPDHEFDPLRFIRFARGMLTTGCDVPRGLRSLDAADRLGYELAPRGEEKRRTALATEYDEADCVMLSRDLDARAPAVSSISPLHAFVAACHLDRAVADVASRLLTLSELLDVPVSDGFRRFVASSAHELVIDDLDRALI